jgi:hypothetical protein
MMKLEYDAVCLYDYKPKYLLMHQQYSRLLGKQSASLGKDVVTPYTRERPNRYRDNKLYLAAYNSS